MSVSCKLPEDAGTSAAVSVCVRPEHPAASTLHNVTAAVITNPLLFIRLPPRCFLHIILMNDPHMINYITIYT